MSLGVRWTVGDVSRRGWEALRLSVWCAVRLFGPETAFRICVNGLDVERARLLAGPLPACVGWQAQTAEAMPELLRRHMGPEMAEGVGWKLVPLHVFADRHELALDSDCILWSRPAALEAWLAGTDRTLMAEDVERYLGQFQGCAAPGAINSGVRGLPPGFPLGAELGAAIAQHEAETGRELLLHSELDEQGLQAAALHRRSPALLVRRSEVSICSPFWPRDPEPGTCGAHFVGLNPRHLPWNYFDRTADEVEREHWDRHRPALYARAGLELTPPLRLDEA